MNRYVRLYFFSFLFAIITAFPMYVFASWQPEISIGIARGVSEIRFTATSGGLHIYADSGKKPILIIPQGKELNVNIVHNNFFLNGDENKNDYLIIQPAVDGFIKVNGMPYRGYIKVLKKNGMTVVNNVPIEEYLYGVVPKEMPSGWSQEALRAQSIAARTFALKNRKKHSAEGFDLCNTAHCQVYEGVSAETRAATDAVNSTHGIVLFYKGTIIDALFHTDSGGMTESSENVWGSKVPYLRAASELQMKTQPWTRKFSTDFFIQKIEADGKRIGKLKEIRLSPLNIGKGGHDRSFAGRVLSTEIVGTKGRAVLSGNNLRAIFSLPSTLFDIQDSKSYVTFKGYGSGHGLGLSQWGAKALADKGKNYKEILHHYYTGVTLEKLY